MPADAAGIGTASDPETGDVIAIGVVTRRRTYNKTGYICQKDAPAELHACACALLELDGEERVEYEGTAAAAGGNVLVPLSATVEGEVPCRVYLDGELYLEQNVTLR